MFSGAPLVGINWESGCCLVDCPPLPTSGTTASSLGGDVVLSPSSFFKICPFAGATKSLILCQHMACYSMLHASNHTRSIELSLVALLGSVLILTGKLQVGVHRIKVLTIR